ncbi:MAG TPA: gluconokinase [Streptosporangiaceae bacterium]|nr:gluconokinase [Streptosporangiaceae bacterium]
MGDGPAGPIAAATPADVIVRAVIVAGVSGSGKTTVGELLAARLGWQFTDGDALHPAANIAKMASGQPLTDQDRAPWLRRIGEVIDAELTAGLSLVVACSALKRRYRTELLSQRPEAWMAFLLIGLDEACRRLGRRRGHFFEPDLVSSQFAALEEPGQDEARVVPVPVTGPPGEVTDEIVGRLALRAVPGQ